MDLTSTAVIAATTAFVRKTMDEIYTIGKSRISDGWDLWRAAVKDRNVAKAISKVTHVKTLWNIEKEVSLYDFYYPSQIEYSTGVKKLINSLKEVPSKSNLIVQGTAGQGKSIFLRYLCGQELRGEYTSGRFPLFVELRRIRQGSGVNELLLEALDKYGINSNKDKLDVYLSSGKFVLLLDAFDEIDPTLAQQALGEIEYLADKYNESTQIIITSRPSADIQYSSRFRVCKLQPLKPSDHLPFLKTICSDKNQAEDLAKVISSSPADVKSLLTSPLMLTLLVMLYKSIQTVPDTVPRFYEELFDVLFFRHDHSKPGFRRKRYTNLDDSKIRSLFSAFCFYARWKGLGIISLKQFDECCGQATKAIGVTVDSRKFKDEIVKTVCLMQEEGFELSFIHKSVAEYYAASFVADSSEEFATKFYSHVLNRGKSDDWALELKFLSIIDNYRYSRFYVIDGLAMFQTKYGIELGDHLSKQDEEKLFNLVTDDTHLQFEHISKSIYKIKGWRRPVLSVQFANRVVQEWLNAISDTELKCVLPKEFIAEKSEPDHDDHHDDQDSILLPALDCLEFLPPEVKKKALDSAAIYLVNNRQDAISIISREEEKNTLFD